MRRRKLFTLAAAVAFPLCLAGWFTALMSGWTYDAQGNEVTYVARQPIRGLSHEVPRDIGWGFLALMPFTIYWHLKGFIFPAVQRRHVRRCAHRGLCAACGYDLRATPERCPECGAVPGGRG
jgi:hypothetical protein